MDIRYQRGKIYTNRCRDDNDKIYVGSTIETLAKRLAKHRCDSKREKKQNIKLYQNVNNDWDNWYIMLYENHPCNSKEELLKREGQIIRKIRTLNNKIAGRTQKEYAEYNKEKTAEYQKNYYQENILKIKNKSKETVKCECGCEVRKIDLQRHTKTTYHLQTLNPIPDSNKEKVVCECGKIDGKYNISKHKKTKKHLQLLNPIA